MGFSFSGAAPNKGMIFTRLKSYEERRGASQSLNAVLARVRGPLAAIPGASVVVFSPPAIQGLSALGGFQFEVLDQTGGPIGGLSQALAAITGAAARSDRVVGTFSQFRANDPQLVVTIDRDRARSLGVPLREVTDALQVFVGSTYVNDFDFNNRAYRVYVQADQRFRAQPADLGQLYVRSQTGQLVRARQRRPLHRGDGAAGHQPLQPVPLGRDQRIGGAGGQLGPGDPGDGADRARAPAAGLRFRVGRPGAAKR